MDYKNAVGRYKATQVNTADGGRLIVMLYEGAIRCIDEAIRNMDYQHYDVVNRKIQKTVDIIDELRFSLDMKVGDIAVRLRDIYVYLVKRLNEANQKKTIDPLKEVKERMEELLSAWRTIGLQGEKSDDSKKPFSPEASSGGISLQG